MLRNRQLLISDSLHAKLRAVADVLGLDSPETVAEAWLTERLDTMPEMADRAKMLSAAFKQADKEWRAKWQPEATAADEIR